MDNGGLILLVFLAFLFAWVLNRVRRALRFGPVAYAGVMVVFIIVMLAVWTQTFR
jgi:high-affinity Fe2+/Pb2+ permease